MSSLLDRAVTGIQPDELRGFLQERHLESERLDYKLDLNRRIADTLVADSPSALKCPEVGRREAVKSPAAR